MAQYLKQFIFTEPKLIEFTRAEKYRRGRFDIFWKIVVSKVFLKMLESV